MKSKLVIEADEEGNVHITPHHTGMYQLAVMAGAIQNYAGLAALSGGVELEEIKDQLLDVHFAAMDMLTEEAIRRSRSVGNGGGNEKDGIHL